MVMRYEGEGMASGDLLHGAVIVKYHGWGTSGCSCAMHARAAAFVVLSKECISYDLLSNASYVKQ